MSSSRFQFNRQFSLSFEEASWHYDEQKDELVIKGKNGAEISMTLVQFEFLCRDSIDLIHFIGDGRRVETQ